MSLLGTSFIGATRGSTGGAVYHAFNPATGKDLEPDFFGPAKQEVELAAQLAAEAFPYFSRISGKKRAEFLRSIASHIEALGDTLTQRAMAESGLPVGRINGETARTTGQLRLHAQVLEEGSWVDARIDHGDAARQPLPKPDLRSMHRAIGPVAVFCASNFPLAFSVAGGDACAAWAAGCPVIVKSHTSHPGTAELVAGAVRAAVADCDLPEGVFSLLHGSGFEVGQALVKHPEIKAVGFTGSRKGGRALMDLAAARPEPIPVYAEMSSINPTFFFAGALEARGAALATALHGSVTAGVGQMCTCPGVIVVEASPAVESFKAELIKLMNSTPPGVMLSQGISENYRKGVESLVSNPNARQLAHVANESGKVTGSAALFETTVDDFIADSLLGEEIFGPATILVHAKDKTDILKLIPHLEGQLTAAFHGTDEEIAASSQLISALEKKAGRLICNGFSTGVEVCHAMIHGGPYPATSDGRSTSVGVQAVARFTRPVSFQNFPDAALPAELQESNPLKISRIEDGKRVG